MDRTHALDVLRRSERILRSRGVLRAAIFGSVARGDARPDSDLDVLIEIDPGARLTIYDYAALKSFIAELFAGPVDVIDRNALKPELEGEATADALYAF